MGRIPSRLLGDHGDHREGNPDEGGARARSVRQHPAGGGVICVVPHSLVAARRHRRIHVRLRYCSHPSLWL